VEGKNKKDSPKSEGQGLVASGKWLEKAKAKRKSSVAVVRRSGVGEIGGFRSGREANGVCGR
jgi:hypothetical protein